MNPWRDLLRRWLGTIVAVRTEAPVAALTFDDGPHPVHTPRLLQVLQRHRAQATFFMLGAAAVRQPELLRRVAEAGHVIGSHSQDHPSLPTLPARERRRQIRQGIRALGAYDSGLFRPPFGDQSRASCFDAFILRRTLVGWSLQVEDWLEQNSRRMAQRLVAGLRPGCIVLLHDDLAHCEGPEYLDRAPMIEAVDQLLKTSPFRFVTVPELLRQGEAVRRLHLQAPDRHFQRRLVAVAAGGRRG
jgi:peptidoglycan-N-acetylglucosamine deacetylase